MDVQGWSESSSSSSSRTLVSGLWWFCSQFPSANRSMWLTAVMWRAVVSHKCTNNKIYSVCSPARALNRSESSCDKTVTAHREDLIKFLSWTLKTSGSPCLMLTAAKFFFPFLFFLSCHMLIGEVVTMAKSDTVELIKGKVVGVLLVYWSFI